MSQTLIFSDSKITTKEIVSHMSKWDYVPWCITYSARAENGVDAYAVTLCATLYCKHRGV